MPTETPTATPPPPTATHTGTPTTTHSATHTPTPTLPPPTSTPTLTPTPTPPDDDGDGVPNAVENACPAPTALSSCTSPSPGDCNCDGTADGEQSNVSSLPGPNGYLTLWNQSCPQNANVVALMESELPTQDPAALYPFGLVGFTLPECETANLQIIFHGPLQWPLASLEYKKFGPTTPGVLATVGFYVLPGAVFSGNSVSFTLEDNKLGDDTGDDGTIVDQGGPAVPNPMAPVPVVAPLGAFGLVTLLLLTGVCTLWRRGRHVGAARR
ncbi:hypothetical protein HRbin30_03190 [bacterium HR30]|nr:hypothetical protein HRbin30_03190 [bacterium HR30]